MLRLVYLFYKNTIHLKINILLSPIYGSLKKRDDNFFLPDIPTENINLNHPPKI